MLFNKILCLSSQLRISVGMGAIHRILNTKLFVTVNEVSVNSQNFIKAEFGGMHEHANYFSNIVNFLKRDLINVESRTIELKNLTVQLNQDKRPYLYITLKDQEQFLIAENEAYSVFLCYKKNHTRIARIKKLIDDTSTKTIKCEYCAEIVYEDTDTVIGNDPDEYYIQITPNVIMHERALDSIRESLTNQQFILHPHNLSNEAINKLNHLHNTTDQQLMDYDHLENSNLSQKLAIQMALNNNITLIQGPPGTGKTETCANLIGELLRKSHGKILVCAASNIAVDNIAEKLHKNGVKVVRVYPRYMSNQDLINGPEYSLHKLLGKTIHDSNDEQLIQLHRLVDEDKYSFTSQIKLYNEMIFSKELKILEECDVICCTCVLSGSHAVRHFNYDAVIVDEASQPTEAESLIPLRLTTNKIVLIGDHQQLGPVIHDSCIDEAVKLTLFERLIKLGIKPVLLDTQYRMHPALSEFSSKQFYESRIKNGIPAEHRVHNQVNFKWPNPNLPMFFKATYGIEETPFDSKSHYNMTECNEVIKITTELIKCGVPASTIGIISPYSAQRNLISTKLHDHMKINPNFSGIVVASVHAFQGREKDYIIISCVRSNDLKTVGFLVDPRQLNVAISRAKYGLIILGNPFVLRNSPVWCDYLDYFKEKDLIVSGEYPNFMPLNNYS